VTLIALAGLPGAGKSTLARALAAELGAPVFDKDTVRAALFGPDRIEYSREQDDLCWELTLRAAAWELARRRPACAILDGRTYCRAGQVEALRTFAARAGLRLLLVECTCGEAAACERLAGDAAAGRHPAADRGPELHRRLRAEAVPIEGPKLVLDTERLSLDEQLAAVCGALPAGIADPD